MQDLKKIALLIETSTSYGRELIRGIARYANLNTSWIFFNEPRGITDKLPQIRKWKPDGIIMRDTPENMKLLKLKIPIIVSIRYEKRVENFPNIISDSDGIGKMACEYFRNKGFTRFAFCGFDNMPWSHERQQAFRQSLVPKEHFYIYENKKSNLDYEQELKWLAKWLESLPKPIALLACNDVKGAKIIEACKLAQIKIPQDIAILGVNNDDMICEITSPSLSSIALDIAKAGYEAGKTLDRIIKKRIIDVDEIIVKPKGIITRMSTDFFAINDVIVAHSLHYISENDKRIIQVSDVAKYVGTNRRNLERRFRQILGRSVHQEIKRTKIEAISKVLIETDIPISEIAFNMGFNDDHHISRYFKSIKNISPLKFREQYRLNMLKSKDTNRP